MAVRGLVLTVHALLREVLQTENDTRDKATREQRGPH